MTNKQWKEMVPGEYYKYEGMYHIKHSDGTQWSLMPSAFDDIEKFESLPEGLIIEEPKDYSKLFGNCRLDIVDFGVTEFKGIEFTLKDGTTNFYPTND